MTDKQLKDKAIDIKGKDYVMVKDRISYFNEMYPSGSIRTRILSSLDSDTYVIEAKVIPDPSNLERYFSGHSQATIGDGMVNKTAALENAETSAVGRALAMMGIGVIDSIASVDEMNKAVGSQNQSYASIEPEDDLIVSCKDCGSSTTYREGVKDGKKWRAYFCNDKCGAKPYFIR